MYILLLVAIVWNWLWIKCSFASFLREFISFIYFSYPTVTSSTMWDSCVKSCCFILILREWEGIKYIIIHIIYAVCLKKELFSDDVNFLLCSLTNRLFRWIISSVFFLASVETLFLHHIIFVICFIIVVTYCDWFLNVKSTLHSWENST